MADEGQRVLFTDHLKEKIDNKNYDYTETFRFFWLTLTDDLWHLLIPANNYSAYGKLSMTLLEIQ